MRFAAKAAAPVMTLAVSMIGCQKHDPGMAKGTGTSVVQSEPVGSADGIDFAPYLATAHAIIAHAPLPSPAPPLRAGQRVFVTAWSAGHAPIRGTGIGPTLLESVVRASDEVAKMAPESPRIEIDMVTETEAIVLAPEIVLATSDAGLNGYLAYGDGGKVGWVLPGEVLQAQRPEHPTHQKVLSFRSEAILTTIASRAGVTAAEAQKMQIARFRVSETVEPARQGEKPIALFRQMPVRGADLTPDALLGAVRAGADYLAGAVHDDGSFEYMYDPVSDKAIDESYSIIRHAGAIYALMEAYDEFRVPAWREKARKATTYLKTFLQAGPDGTCIASKPKQEQQKVGGTGLVLVAMSKYAEVTGNKSDLDVMRAMGRCILHQQYPDGHFRENADVMREDTSARDLKREIWYYAGEGVLGLVRLNKVDPDGAWIGGAKRGADYLVHVRDAKISLEDQIPDHWLSYALHDLYVLTKDQAYAEHAFKIARSILPTEKTPANAPYADYVGSFYENGETTPTSTRLEALVSTIQLSRFMGADDAWLTPSAKRLGAFTSGEQIDEESAFFVANPSRAKGGVRESLINSNVRIDYVQHSMSAWLRLARLLRDPAYGKAS